MTKSVLSISLREKSRGAWVAGTALLMAVLLAGCASGPSANPRDPLEPLNRGVFKFNDAVDAAVLKPVATVYHDVIPRPIRQGVNNVFGNLQDAWSVVNNSLQLKGEAAVDSFFRFSVNSVFGLGGIFDVASEMNIEKHTKDFGHTLGFWGVPSGPYLVLPLLGPSTVRDTAALPVDWQGDIVTGIAEVPARNSATVLRVVDLRADLLQATSILEGAALDKYSFTRDAFLQSRRSAIFDGNPPDEEVEDKTSPQQDAVSLRVDALTETASGALSSTGVPGVEKVKP